MSLRWRHNDRDGVSNHQPRLFAQPFIYAQIKGNIKAPRHWLLCGEFTVDRCIPRTKGQLRGKCFHLMTSSCMCMSNNNGRRSALECACMSSYNSPRLVLEYLCMPSNSGSQFILECVCLVPVILSIPPSIYKPQASWYIANDYIQHYICSTLGSPLCSHHVM